MRVLVTRPVEDAGATAARLRELGHELLIAPLLEIRFRDGPELSLDGFQAIVATSANGVRALIGRTLRPATLPIFAVGPQTAALAREAGFADVQEFHRRFYHAPPTRLRNGRHRNPAPCCISRATKPAANSQAACKSTALNCAAKFYMT